MSSTVRCDKAHPSASQGNGCVVVEIPANAELDVYGTGWSCKRGFYRSQGNGWVVVEIPANAELDVYGSGWACKTIFKRVSNACTLMSAAEIAAQNELLKQQLERRRQTISRGNTYTSRRGAEFTVNVRDADLNCSETYSGGYDRCEIEIRYEVRTNYNGNNTPTARIRCEVSLEYTDKNGYRGSTSEDETKSVSISGDSESGRMEIDASFATAAVRVRLTEATCKIVDVS